jgi:vacuolar-type H+-ATPase subunit C/Vma6
LTAELRRLGFPLSGEGVPPPAELELAVRRWAAAALATLARWAGRRVATLAIIYEDEDRKSLRAMLRGAVGRVPAEARLSGLIPTPTLPERALEELAHQVSVAAVVTLLQVWGSPYAAALSAAGRAAEPDLFAIELALDRAFAARALSAARSGGPDLLAFVRESVDLANAVTALLLAVAGRDVVPKEAFLLGGVRVSIVTFEEAAAAPGAGQAGVRLARAFTPSPLAVAFHDLGADPGRLEDALLRLRVHELQLRARLSPLGPAPVLWFALRLKACVIDLQRIIWGTALGAPGADLVSSLVTAA